MNMLALISLLLSLISTVTMTFGHPLEAISIAIISLVVAVLFAVDRMEDVLCRISQAWWAHPLVRKGLKPD